MTMKINKHFRSLNRTRTIVGKNVAENMLYRWHIVYILNGKTTETKCYESIEEAVREMTEKTE